MAKTTKHAHSAIIDQLGADLVRNLYKLSRGNLHTWRIRGVPFKDRFSFARNASLNGVVVPPDFFDNPKRKAQ